MSDIHSHNSPTATTGVLSTRAASLPGDSAHAEGDERRRLVDEWAGGSASFPDSPSLVARFEAQATRTPDAIALTYDGARLTYRALNARANQVAHFLTAQGVGRDSLVGLFLERGVDLLVGLLGILKSGAAYLPMDLAYPADRLAFMAGDGQANIILSSTVASKALDLSTARVVLLDAHWPVIAAFPDLNVGAPIEAHHLAYVIYTSGSTGTPKGCEVTHGNVVRLFEACQPRFAFTADDVWTMFHSHAFDFSVWEMWGAWLHGGHLVLVPQNVSRSPAQMLELLRDERVTVLNQTPSAFKQLTAEVSARTAAMPLSLRYVIFGGEALEAESLRGWFDRYGDSAPQLINGYGITETTVFVSFQAVTRTDLGAAASVPIGVPMPDLRCFVLNEHREVVRIGAPGELYIGGPGVTRGYLRRADLTAARFIDWSPGPGYPPARYYKSGDLVRWLPSGVLEFLGRIDQQVKIRGFRIELGEVENVLAQAEGVATCAVVARSDRGTEPRLVAYVVSHGAALSYAQLRAFMHGSLPSYMVPTAFVQIDALPITANGKLDQRALPAPERERPALGTPFVAAQSAVEQACCDAFAEVLQLDRVGRNDNFFELGGDSLLAVLAADGLQRRLERRVSAASVFTNASPATLAHALTETTVAASVMLSKADASQGDVFPGSRNEPIAIVAMAARLPGAETTEEFWQNLLDERDCITRFTPDELDASVPEELRSDPAYVSARSVLRNPDGFDPAFFAMSQREAEVMDPQQRLLLELSWEVLERAGYAPDRTGAEGRVVGVFAGVYSAEYLRKNVYANPDAVRRVGEFAAMLATDKDYVATRVAHKLNLTGPAVSVHTACSTALVAIVQALDSLRAGRCNMAIAGGASMTYPPRSGYLYQEGAMLSKDGVTRTFDAAATGTVFGDGGAVILMKRLRDAVRDGDQIYAVIKGAGLNNDGGNKASFTAPSVDGQAAVIAAALHDAGVNAGEITYVEAHGTATALGDPIEIEGLTKAFRGGVSGTDQTGYCRIGTAKSNVGHVVAAAGAVGVIKTALSLTHETLPATLHFTSPNPAIDFDSSPFVVNGARSQWPRGGTPRLAGVSAFGVGGTNAHVILEEAPARTVRTGDEGGPHILRLSARTATALQHAGERLAEQLRSDPTTSLGDVAHTLRVGRTEFTHRAVVIAQSREEAVASLSAQDHPLRSTRVLGSWHAERIFMFPGQGAQYPQMGAELYEREPVFRAACDEVFAAVNGVASFDLRERMFTADDTALLPTSVTQPATFCLEYALAALWKSRGVVPSIMIGHSIGEFVAGVLGGVMTLPDAARLIVRRGALMNSLPSGSMLSVRLSATKLLERMPSGLSLAAENSPTASVVSGPTEEIRAFASQLDESGIVTRELRTSHAFHSSMMDPILSEFERAVAQVTLHAPKTPIISTLTGALLTDAEATSAEYWARQLSQTVRFATAVETALQRPAPLFLEVGPRHTLSTLVRQQIAARGTSAADAAVIASLTDGPFGEVEAFALAVGQFWLSGADADVPVSSQHRRVRLPTYPFERVRCWLDATPRPETLTEVSSSLDAVDTLTDTALPSHSSVSEVMAASAVPQPLVDRRSVLIDRLRTVFEDVSGFDIAIDDAPRAFVELGLDSLVLTQAAIQVKKAFKVSVSFRQLMEEYRSLASLAEYLDATLPADAVEVPRSVAAMPSAPRAVATAAISATPQLSALGPSSTSTSFAEQVIQQQLQIMQQQLAVLGGTSTPAAEVAAALEAAPTSPGAPIGPGATPTSDDDATPHTTYDVKKAFGAIARIHTRPTSTLTESQTQRLTGFMKRYAMRTRASKTYTEAHRSHLADPRVVNGFRPQTKEICYQIVIERSKGARMWDLDGNEYVDALNGFGMSLFGWQPRFVNDAVKLQIDQGHDIGPQTPLAGEVAELVCEMTGFDRAALCNTGSEAVMGAIRIARTVTARNLIVTFSGSYHGIFDEVLLRGTKKLRAVPAAPGIMASAAENVLVLDYGTPESLEIIRSRAHELAAVLVEPVQSRRPDFQPVDFLRELREVTAESGTVLIFDEVISGFRAHQRGAQGLFGVTADLATYGKVVGGGYPIGIIAGKREFMDALDGGTWEFGDDSFPTVGVTYFAGTFVRHPLALAACRAALLYMRAQGPTLQSALTERTAAMAAEMNAFARNTAAPVEIRQFASLWRITFTEEHPLQDLLWAMMRHRGIHILDNFPCFLTTAHTTADIAAIVQAFKEAVTEMQDCEFLPGSGSRGAAEADASKPPVPNARLGRDRDGTPAWFVPDPAAPGQYLKLMA
jgi:amino acid adenylation domain-containing protein